MTRLKEGIEEVLPDGAIVTLIHTEREGACVRRRQFTRRSRITHRSGGRSAVRRSPRTLRRCIAITHRTKRGRREPVDGGVALLEVDVDL